MTRARTFASLALLLALASPTLRAQAHGEVPPSDVTTEEPGPDGRAPGSRATTPLEVMGYGAAIALGVSGALSLLAASVVLTTPTQPDNSALGYALFAGGTGAILAAPLLALGTYALAGGAEDGT